MTKAQSQDKKAEAAKDDRRITLDNEGVQSVLDKVNNELVGLAPVKARIGQIASLLMIDRARRELGLTTEPPTLHMSFTGNPGTGKTTMALRMAEILYKLGYVRSSHLVSVTRDDLVGQYIGHTAPKTKEVIKRAMGGVLFIDEAYYLYRPENERDYGQEAIEILLQSMENDREDLVVIVAGYKDRMAKFFQSNPGLHSRIAHHIEFPDYDATELLQVGDILLEEQGYRFSPDARKAFADYLVKRMQQPHFSNARSVRNALDRFRLRQAMRLVEQGGSLGIDDLATIQAKEVLDSTVFGKSADGLEKQAPAAKKPAGKAAKPAAGRKSSGKDK